MKTSSSAFWCSLCAASVLFGTVLAAGAQEATAPAAQQYNLAVQLHNSEMFDSAAEEWMKFIKQHASDSRVDRAWHFLGVCYLKQKKWDEALKAFQTVVKSYPEFYLLADTYLNLGLAQYNIAQGGKAAMYGTAAETFHTLAAKFPQGKHVAEAVYYEGECLYHRGQKKEAAEKYRTVVKSYPDHALAARAMFALAVTQTELEQHQAALETYDAFLQKFSKHPLAVEASLWRGESLYGLRRYAEAAKAYAVAAETEGFEMADYATLRQADAMAAGRQHAQAAARYASLSASFPESQYVELGNLRAGRMYYAAGDFAKVEEFMGKVIAAGGKSVPEAAHWTVQSLLKQHKPAEALAVVEKILPAAGEGSYAVSLLMDQADATYEIAGRRGESVGLYAALAAKHPRDPLAPHALYMAAFAALNLGDYQAAVTHGKAFTAAHAGHDLEVDVWHVLAESHLALHQYAEAEKLYDQLLEKAPSDRDAPIWKVHRATALYQQKKHQQAVAALEPAMAEISTPDLVAEGWYWIGRSRLALKEFDAARKSLESSLSAEPKWKLADDARVMLAYAYQQTGNLEQAKQNARRVIADFPNSRWLDVAHYRLGECSRLGGDLKAAVTEYNLVVTNWPKSALMPHVLYGLGWAQLGREDYAAAEETFSRLVGEYPRDDLTAQARYGRGKARRQLKKYAPAIEDIRASLAADLSAAEKLRARHLLGLCQEGLKQHEEAVSTFRKLLEEAPNYSSAAEVYYELGWELKSLKREAEAAETFAKLAQQFSESPLAAESHYLAGDYAFGQKDYRKAAVAYYAAMNKTGKAKLGEEAAYKLALCYYFQDEIEKAQRMFNYQRRTWPEGTLASDGLFREAECFFKQKKYQEALTSYQLVENPSNKELKPWALLRAGQAAGQLKQWEKSLALASRCVEQFPDSPCFAQALYQQGWAQQNLGKQEEALAIYGQVVAKSNQEPAARAQFMIGEIQFEQKKHAEAIKSYFKAGSYPYAEVQADAIYEAARCFEVMGKKSQALKQYQRLLKEYPTSDKVPLAKKRIEVLK